MVRRTLDLLAEKLTLAIPCDNRWLVEGATHPEALTTLDSPLWQRHGQEVEGGAMAQAVQATLVSIRPQPFGSFTFNPLNATVQTRLGLNDRRVRLDRTVTSPFGQRLAELVIPGYLAPVTVEEEAVVLAEQADGLTLRYGDMRYRYSRLGLERLERV